LIAEINGTEIYYKIMGEGKPMMMMHGGLGQDHKVFSPWLEPLEERYKVIYYDHRGNGRSGRPPLETLTHENFARDAEELRQYLEIDKMILFGHSYGSFLAMEYAIRYQEHLSHLILVGTAPSYEFLDPCREKTVERLGMYGLDTPENRVLVDKWILGEFADEEEYNKFGDTLKKIYPPHPERSKEIIRCFETANYTLKHCLLKYDVREGLGRIKVPTLVINGRDDWDTVVEQAELVHKGIPNSDFVVLEKSGHEPFADETELFLETLYGWIDKPIHVC
jgi:proline iminopeptidase